MKEAELVARLERVMANYADVMIAFSGGVDSSVVAKAARVVLGDEHVLAVIADSPSLARDELTAAKELATAHDIPLEIVQTNEMQKQEYVANDGHRCYFCKTELFSTLTMLTEKRGTRTLLDGFNRDDEGDYRPGMQAASEWHSVSPLRLAGFTKEDVRAVAKWYGLANWNKPAAPCLSSRFPYQTPITLRGLSQVEKAEQALHQLGFYELRVRHHQPVARIEVPEDQFAAVIEQREKIVEAVLAAGYLFVSLDLVGLRSGSLNSVLGVKPVV